MQTYWSLEVDSSQEFFGEEARLDDGQVRCGEMGSTLVSLRVLCVEVFRFNRRESAEAMALIQTVQRFTRQLRQVSSEQSHRFLTQVISSCVSRLYTGAQIGFDRILRNPGECGQDAQVCLLDTRARLRPKTQKCLLKMKL